MPGDVVMMRAVQGLRSVLVTGMVLTLGTVAGCGSDGSSSSQGVSTNTNVYPIDRSTNGPTIAGVPQTTAVADQPYSFQPQVANTTSTAKFTVTHLPSWAKFNSSTGQVSGTPAATQVGQYTGITVSLVDAGQTVSLPAFTITVAEAGSSSSTVTLSWQAPTENADGTQLVDLKGYKVHYGSASKSYSEVIQVPNAGLTTYVVDNLAKGTYYFAVTAYNSAGGESALSGEVTTRVN